MLYLPKYYFCPKVTFFHGWEVQHALHRVCFSSNATCRFHGGGSPPTAMYGSQLLRLVHRFWEMFLYEVPGNCFTGISPPLFNHNWKTRCLPRSSVTYDRFQEVFEKMLKECRVFGLKRERGEQAEKTPSRMKISLETLEINHSLCPQKTGQKKIRFIFWKDRLGYILEKTS